MGVVDPIGETPRFGGTTSAWQPSSGAGRGIPPRGFPGRGASTAAGRGGRGRGRGSAPGIQTEPALRPEYML